MSEKTSPTLSGVSETLLIPLYNGAMESQRPDAMIKDEKAVMLVTQMGLDFSWIKQIKMNELLKAMRIIFTREMDRYARDFISRHPDAVAVHIGCGLDTRFERVDDGRVEWYDLDLPDVIELRRKLIREQGERHHLLSGSVFDFAWLEAVDEHRQRPFLFIAEGVFPYFEAAQIKSFVSRAQKEFPGAELVFDAHTPFVIWADNLQLAFSKVSARMKFALKHGRDVEAWGDPSTSASTSSARRLGAGGIRMLEEWFYFGADEPRVRPYRWMRRIPLVGKSTGIFHYRLGNSH